MKILFISLRVLLLAFIIVQLFALNGQKILKLILMWSIKNTTHLKSSYEASLFTAVKLSTKKFKEASSQGFSILAIFWRK
jgi:hypothetical protein